MSRTTFKELKERADSIYQRYDAHFAGKARATRDLELLDTLLADLEGVIEEGTSQINGSRDPAIVSLLEMARDNQQVYRDERQAIVEAKEAGPISEEAARVIADANLVFGQYRRHFAGKDRRTRDMGLLMEIITDLEEVRARMKALVKSHRAEIEPNLQIVEDNLRMYRNEAHQVEAAQTQGTPQEQADLLATLANEQFSLYRDHFAGKSRLTRREGLLERMIEQLKRARVGMQRLKKRGLRSQANERNVGIITDNVKLYTGELAAIKEARAELTTEQIAGSLGAAANEVMAEYREHFAGQNRATRDLAKLSLMCDQLAEIGRQMHAIEVKSPLEMNAKNLDIVSDTRTMYEREYREVEKAKVGA
ncbi:hypothetical protein EA187_01100 [Lujinxingia sediminis]|uniref:Uncharacterized protein n=1 Tax=Lujinxingia sediminis TaxID=2480984 RepID=A0ABY0CWS6_9DELT|nr:hypothetical protein [Lujinxingia sediminis]RVU48064.1 hypothetical protein EA187_01100 [Lujinxingia sediminis]